MAVTMKVTTKSNKPKKAASKESSVKVKKSVPVMSSASRPKYSQMILHAVIDTKGQGKKNVSRQDIVKYVVATYNLDPAAASRHINLNLKKMVESGQLKPAAAAGRKGAGSFRLGQAVKEKKTTGKPRKATAAKKTTAAKTKGNKASKATKGTETSKGTKPKSVAAGKSKKVSSAKPKKAPKAVKSKK